MPGGVGGTRREKINWLEMQRGLNAINEGGDDYDQTPFVNRGPE